MDRMIITEIEDIASIIRSTPFPINMGDTTVGEKRLSDADSYKLAEVLYNAGYKKQYKGEWVVCGDGEKVPFVCTHCCKITSWATKQTARFCPNCGAKMKLE